jgi:hypothetical protein
VIVTFLGYQIILAGDKQKDPNAITAAGLVAAAAQIA